MNKPKGFDEPEYYLEYDEYIHSELWQKKRMERLTIDDFRCVKCGSPINVQVHHLRYPFPFGTEDVRSDLVTLCEKCHVRVHESKLVERPYTTRSKVEKFIEIHKHLDNAFGGKENLCKLETVKHYWALMYGNDERCPCQKIQGWFRNKKIEKILKWKSEGATPEDLARTGISRQMIYKYWNDEKLARTVLSYEL